MRSIAHTGLPVPQSVPVPEQNGHGHGLGHGQGWAAFLGPLTGPPSPITITPSALFNQAHHGQSVMLSLGAAQNLTYYKRYRMEIEVWSAAEASLLPAGYQWLPWREDLLDCHADALYHCFADELDSQVFPSLGSPHGCRQLMREIRRKPGFLPAATWLVTGPDGACGTVQGVRDRTGTGAIQNVGITRRHRCQGLGRTLVLQALAGFRQAGLQRVVLEVTARNEAAVRLYQRIGFRKRKTLYKAVDAVSAALSLVPDV
jgi:RimJ/RimL family protein N-acetyltransferase